MKYALIGCGRVSPNHLKAAKENGFNIVAVCDIRKENIEDMFTRSVLSEEEISCVRCYDNYIEMLEKEDLELVSIALPSGLHAEAALAVIERKIHCIIEKPMAMSLEDADKIIALSEKKGVVVSACHQNRFNEAVQQMRKAFEDGRFGKISNAAITVRWHRGPEYYSQGDWRGKWESDGGTLMNQCIHGIDLLRWFCGDDIVSVYGITKRHFHPYIEAEDVGTAVVEFSNGAIATIEGSVNVYGKNLEQHLSLFGETGVVKLGGTSANAIDVWSFADNPEDNKNGFHEKTMNVYGNGHTSLFRDVALAIKNGTKPYVDAKAGRNALELVLAIYKSSQSGEKVLLPLKTGAGKDFEGLFEK